MPNEKAPDNSGAFKLQLEKSLTGPAVYFFFFAAAFFTAAFFAGAFFAGAFFAAFLAAFLVAYFID